MMDMGRFAKNCSQRAEHWRPSDGRQDALNRMINVTPSNHKLFLRCTGLVKLLP